jgi:hypothetical protein
VRTPVRGRREATVTFGRAFIDGAVRATWLRKSTTRACPAGIRAALACDTNTMQQVAAESTAAATLKVPRREPRDLRVVSTVRLIL